jgi:hypothetical protein
MYITYTDITTATASATAVDTLRQVGSAGYAGALLQYLVHICLLSLLQSLLLLPGSSCLAACMTVYTHTA